MRYNTLDSKQLVQVLYEITNMSNNKSTFTVARGVHSDMHTRYCPLERYPSLGHRQMDTNYTQSKSVTWASAFNVATKGESAGFTV